MANIKFTSALKRFFPGLDDMKTEGATVAEVLRNINERFPGLIDYVLEEDGSLRKHVNIFLDSEMISDRRGLSDSVVSAHEILIYQALSGG